MAPATVVKPWPDANPEVDALVEAVMGRVADKWTLLVLKALAETDTPRFTELGRQVGGVSQKMLTQTLRAMERDGLVQRTVHPWSRPTQTTA